MKNHGITDSEGLEITFADQLVQSLLFPTQESIQGGFHYLQRRRSKILSSQPALVLCQPHRKDVFPSVRTEFPLLPFVADRHNSDFWERKIYS